MLELNKIHFGDCLELLKKIPDESIDVFLCDPIYGIDYEDWDVVHKNSNSALGGSSPAQNKSSFKRRGKPINGWSSSDKNIGKEYQEFSELWLNEVFRITKPASPILIFNSRRFYHRICMAAENQGFLVKDMLIWSKNKANSKAQNVNKIPAIKNSGKTFENYRVGNLKPLFEPILYAIKPYKGTLAKCILENKVGGFFSFGSDVKSNLMSYNCENGLHPTQKPLKLMADLIRTFSFEGQIVLDCFVGSGTTCLAAKNLGRNFIGIEKEEKYWKIANQRIGD